MNKNSKIYIAGHNGLIGSAILKKLKKESYKNIITATKTELDLVNQEAVKHFFEEKKPEYVFLCAGKVGSLYAASTYKAEFIYENSMMEYNVIHAAFENEVQKLIFFTSADIYSQQLQQPYKEKHLTDGQVDFNSDSFVLAKVCGIKMCESYNSQYGTEFIAIVAANLYGEKQSYDLLNSTVIPALIKRFHEAKESHLEYVKVWGSGNAIRNFVYVDDLVKSSIFLMKNYCEEYLYNVAYPEDISIKELAYIIKDTIGYKGTLEFDQRKPEGVSSKRIDISILKNMGFSPEISIQNGIRKTYEFFLNEIDNKNIKLKQIKRVSLSQKDENFYNRISANNKGCFLQPNDYKNMVVAKPWGYEFLIYKNKEVAVWFLYIKNDYSTSMHCHPNKKTSLVLLDGNAYSNTFSHRTYLDSNEALIIDKGVFHSTKSLSKNGIYLIEVETPPNKTDLVRLEDRYGRQNCGYEGTSEMITRNLRKQFSYFNFFNENNVTSHKIKNKVLMFEKYDKNEIKKFKTYDDELIISLKGNLIDSTNNIIIEVGDAQYGYKFFNVKSLEISNSDEWHILRIKDDNEKK